MREKKKLPAFVVAQRHKVSFALFPLLTGCKELGNPFHYSDFEHFLLLPERKKARKKSTETT